MVKKLTLLLVLFTITLSAQIVIDPPYILTIDELKNWTQNGPTADPIAIATVPLADRFVNTDTQLNQALSNDLEIAYLPDGMGNFANYGDEQSQFNLYNFTNWSYIDKLIWFGGTADETVQLPSAPWVNTAHKNGVKVLANIFFAPNVFGGSTATMQNFLEQDTNGDFVAVPIMVDMMQYYNFDGWFINEETNTDAATAQLMYEFLRDLTTEVEALGKEVMWYDAMLLSGSVNWQNRLNANNSPFMQNDEDNNPGNGFEQRVSSSMFINFFWGGTNPPNQSKARAATIGRSEFEVFTGVDVWPGRNQAPFETGGNVWMSGIHDNPTSPITSLGLFAPSCVYNNGQYSNFNNDPNDYTNFYSEERHMFAGADRNPQWEDATGFKGYSNWVPAASTITEIPFETNFNTGHGFKKFSEGIETSNSPWHNMNDQDILPTWQFALQDNNIAASWDFDLAYNGGSSLAVEGNNGAPIDLLLYKTQLLLTEDSKIDVIYNYELPEDSNLELIVTFEDDPTQTIALDVSPNGNTGWIGKTRLLEDFSGRVMATIGLRFSSPANFPNYAINIGNIKVHDGPALTIEDAVSFQDAIVLTYPATKNAIEIYAQSSYNEAISFQLYTLQGQKISSHKIENDQKSYRLSTTNLSKGIYLITFENTSGQKITKKILVH